MALKTEDAGGEGTLWVVSAFSVYQDLCDQPQEIKEQGHGGRTEKMSTLLP